MPFPCVSPHWNAQCGTQGVCIAAGSEGQGCDDNGTSCSDCYRGLGGGPGGIGELTTPIQFAGFGGFILSIVSPALEQAGLQVGDVIMKVGKKSVTHPKSVVKALSTRGSKHVKYFRPSVEDVFTTTVMVP